MSVRVSSSELTGIGSRLAYLNRLEKYYESQQWKARRQAKMQSTNLVSEISGLPVEEVHHITYPFKRGTDFKNISLWGSEKDYQLLCLTKAEHEVVHNQLQQFAHKREIKKKLFEYYGIVKK
jgi:hypothetical protein